jgi:hypothetical protein
MPAWMPGIAIPGIYGQAIQISGLFLIAESMDAQVWGRDIHGGQHRFCHAGDA